MEGEGSKTAPRLKDLQSGSEQAWQAFYELHAARLKRVALRYGITEQTADDLVQEALVFFATRIGEIEDTNPEAFLAKKIRWLTLSHLRRVKRLGEVALDHWEDSAEETLDNEHVSDPRIDAIRAQLSFLSRKERLVLSLFYFNRCSYERIAEITGMNYDGVKNTLHRTKRRLKKQL